MEQPYRGTIKPALDETAPGDWHALTADLSGPPSEIAGRVSRMLAYKLCHSNLPKNTADARVAHGFIMRLLIVQFNHREDISAYLIHTQ